MSGINQYQERAEKTSSLQVYSIYILPFHLSLVHKRSAMATYPCSKYTEAGLSLEDLCCHPESLLH